MQALTCPLCDDSAHLRFSKGSQDEVSFRRRANFQPLTCDVYECATCHLIFKDPNSYLAADAEQSRYLQHENSFDDPGYRSFLSRLASPLLSRLKPNQLGLDYGCGPAPVMADLFQEQTCESYDAFFFPRPDLETYSERYDFITCSEVFEHFYHPARELKRITQLLKPGGWLGVMTQAPPEDFLNWHYRLDPTHVMFYSQSTLRWISSVYGYEPVFFEQGVTLMKRSNVNNEHSMLSK